MYVDCGSHEYRVLDESGSWFHLGFPLVIA